MEMTKVLSEANVDSCNVGWYEACSFGAFTTLSLLESQLNHHSSISNSFFLTFDLNHASIGLPSFKAYRLRRELIAPLKEKHFKLISEDINTLFEEIRLQISISCLDQLFLGTIMEKDYSSYEHPLTKETKETISRKSCESVLAALDDSIIEASKIQNFLRSTSKQQQALNLQLQRLVILTASFVYSLFRNKKMLNVPKQETLCSPFLL